MSYIDSLKQKIDLQLRLPVSFVYKPAKKQTDKTVLLLHGYQDNATSLFKRAFGDQEEEFEFNILAPNGVYPAPVKANDGYREAYGWYFVDPTRNLVVVAPEVASHNLLALLKHLGIENHTFVIAGFSQGGILAAFIAQELANVRGIVGLGTLFFHKHYLPLQRSLPVDAIHGDQDDIIPLEVSLKGYEELTREQPRPGKYYQFKNLKHTLNDEARAQLRELIELRLI